MTIDRRRVLGAPLGAAAAVSLPPVTARGAAAGVIPLWPGEAPGLLDHALTEQVIERSRDPAHPDRARHGIRQPRLEVFPAQVPNGAAVLVAPGGGYRRIVIDKEGHEIARWLQARGVSVFVLAYRLPAEGWRDARNAPLADAQRAMRLIRAGAARWRVDPARVAAMGFSAGGHVCADLAVRHGRTAYAPLDAADRQSARPMLAAPIYPVVSMDAAIAHAGSRERLLGATPDPEHLIEHSPDRQVGQHTPPTFLVHAEDDPTVLVANSIVFRAALRAAGVPVETHLFDAGGHGFGWGVRTAGRSVHRWPDLWMAWARTHGLFG